jgi:hypothetical protein
MQNRRSLSSLSLLLSLALLPAGAEAAPFQATPALWPTVEHQLVRERAVPGSALERLIQDNQDFSLLRPEEAGDKIPVPLWLRVWWRKGHPDDQVSAQDPTGGYPRALAEIREWMRTHQDLLPGVPEADVAPPLQRTAVGSNLRISGAAASPRSESDVRVNFWNRDKILAASNNIGGSGAQAQLYSSDGGATWGQTTLPLVSGDSFHSDPAVDWTSDGTAWAVTLGIGSGLKVRAYKSTTGGATWTFDSTVSGTQTNTDKEMIWVDHGASSPFKDNLYVCWHNGSPVYVNRRTASGWGTAPLRVSGAETTGTGIGCDVKTNGAGDVFVFWPDTGGGKILVARSTNGGASFAAPVTIAATFDSYDIGVPSFNSRRALIYTAGAAMKTAIKDEVYATWTDLTGAAGCTSPANEPGSITASPCKTRVWFARSSNGGASWSAPGMVDNPVALNDQFNQWLAVDEATGTLGVIYYDTVNDVGRLKTDVFYQTSGNGGATWSAAVKVTTAMSDETAAGADGGNQYGDYNSLSAFAGAFFPSWTDRRNSGSEEIWTAHVAELPAGAFDFYTLSPCRLVDTRLPDGPLGGPVLQGNAERVFTIVVDGTGACGVPSTARALLTNVTVVAPADGGSLQVYSPDGGPPVTSVVSFSAGQVLANNAIFGLARDGTGRVTVKPGLPGTVHVVIDVSGYFQ